MLSILAIIIVTIFFLFGHINDSQNLYEKRFN